MLRLADGLGRKRAHGKKRRAFGVGELKQARRFSVGRDTRAVNGGDGAGKTDGGDAVGGNGHETMVLSSRKSVDNFLDGSPGRRRR